MRTFVLILAGLSLTACASSPGPRHAGQAAVVSGAGAVMRSAGVAPVSLLPGAQPPTYPSLGQSSTMLPSSGLPADSSGRTVATPPPPTRSPLAGALS